MALSVVQVQRIVRLIEPKDGRDFFLSHSPVPGRKNSLVVFDVRIVDK